MLNLLDEKGSPCGVVINTPKTKVMRNPFSTSAPVLLIGSPIDDVEEYTYLGSQLNMKNDLSGELMRRRKAGWAAFNSIRTTAHRSFAICLLGKYIHFRCVCFSMHIGSDVFGTLGNPFAASSLAKIQELKFVFPSYVFATSQLRNAGGEDAYKYFAVHGIETVGDDATGEQDKKSATDVVLDVQRLTKYYGRRCVLKRITFGVQRNDCFGLVGASGAGKTTTFNIIVGQSYKNSGEIMLNNRVVRGIPAQPPSNQKASAVPAHVPSTIDQAVSSSLAG
ncbi:hypothetical protein TELCIR_02917 [Teladorsagia circumcincta]|uniref:ABC transporter domain-containing protein n=1 Tax=Teladorsagia circumcincta TaxID=45464 RepID=A0A2G9UXR4_TELCI|nr:hypothetical protein TELCIR_02917 [Teladorsagia circumcincta]